jgi:2-dehydropantoate 2-reductase
MNANPGFTPQRFAVVGAGPVGCIVAAFLARGGYDVTLCDIMEDLVKPAVDRGIRIQGAESVEQKVAAICGSVDELADDPPEVIIISVKANALPLIASAIQEFHRDDMVVVSWQNGIDTESELAAVLGETAVLRAVVNYGCGLKGPADVIMPFHHPPHYIQELDSVSRSAAKALADALTRSGLETLHTDQIVSMVWRKTIMNAAMNPVCAVTGLTMAQAMGDPIILKIVDSLVKECVRVARANEISLGWDYYPHAMGYMKNAGQHKPSMLMDIEAGRRTEIDYINGKFVEYGARAGIETPFNTTLRALVKGIESRL